MRIFIFMIITLLVACGGDNGPESTQSDTGTNAAIAAAEKPTQSSAAGAAPCEMLTEAV